MCVCVCLKICDCKKSTGFFRLRFEIMSYSRHTQLFQDFPLGSMISVDQLQGGGPSSQHAKQETGGVANRRQVKSMQAMMQQGVS